MVEFHGCFEYSGPDGALRQHGDCRIQIELEVFTAAPELGAPIVFDLGDIDAVHPEPYLVRIELYTGASLTLTQLGRDREPLLHELMPKFRDRTAKCLLVGDLEEVDRFEGSYKLEGVVRNCPSCGAATGDSKFCPSCGKSTHSEETPAVMCPACGAKVQGKNFCPDCGKPLRADAAVAPHGGPAQFRLYQSNLAVLASDSRSFQWRLADLDSVKAEAKSYQVVLESGNTALCISELGKRTEEFVRKVRDTTTDLLANSSKALHTAFPFLNPDQLQSVSQLLREGGSAPVAQLNAVHPQMRVALEKNAVDAELKPYYADLLKRTATGLLYAGFKIIRPDEQDLVAPSERSQLAGNDADLTGASDANGALDADDSGPAALYWFFFPIAAQPGSSDPANLVAWEASSAAGRATYFFRLFDPAEAAQLKDPDAVHASVRRLNRVLSMLNFRRRPIYLSDAELETDPRFHRYAIAARRIPELRQVRASLLGRAIHSSFDAWQTQVTNILLRA